MNQAQAQLNTQNSQVVAGTFMKYMQDNLSYENVLKPLENAGLKYTSMVPLDQYIFYTIANACTATGLSSDAQVPAASILQINVYEDNTVRMFYNDVE